MQKIIRVVGFACASALASNLACAGPTLDRIQQTGKIVVADDESSMPFSYLDADKKPVGYAIDLCLKIADAVRRKLGMKTLTPTFVAVSSANRVAAIAESKADIECGSANNTAEHRERVAFTVPHYITGARFLVRNDSKIEDVTGFEGKRLVSIKGTPSQKAVERVSRDRFLGIAIQEVADNTRAVEMVEKGEAEGFAMDDVALYGLRAKRPAPDRLKVVGKLLTIEALAIMLPKNDPEFKKLVDEEMKRLISTREAHAIYERWFMQPIAPDNTVLNLPMNYMLKDFWKYPTDQVTN